MKILIIGNLENQDSNCYKIYNELIKLNLHVEVKNKNSIKIEELDTFDKIINFSNFKYDEIDSILNKKENVYNKPMHIYNVRDKLNCYNLMHNKTKMAFTTTSLDEIKQYPIICKIRNGSLGLGVMVANNKQEALLISSYIAQFAWAFNGQQKLKDPILYQELIKESIGKDLRVILIGGKYVACELRQNNTGIIMANLAQGGNANKYELTAEQIKQCENIAKDLNLDYVGIDLLFSNNGELIFNEANHNAFFTGITIATNIDICKKYVEYILKEKN